MLKDSWTLWEDEIDATIEMMYAYLDMNPQLAEDLRGKGREELIEWLEKIEWQALTP